MSGPDPTEHTEERLRALERDAAQLRMALGLPASPCDDAECRLLMLAEAERIAHVGAWSWNLATGAILWSDELYRIFGYDPATVRPSAEGFFAVIHPLDLERVREASDRVLRESRDQGEVESRIVRPDGTLRHVRMKGATTRDAHGHVVIVGSVLDMTERRALEDRLRQSQRMEALGTLAGGVAHDVNNYLQVIGLGTVLAAHGLPAEHPTSRALADIDAAVERCSSLIKQLLAFGRRQVSAPQVVELDTSLLAARGMLENLLGQATPLELTQHAASACVRIDPLQLEQILLNLVLNARDAMPNGGVVTVSTRVRALDEADRALLDAPRDEAYVELCVSDQGVGIPSHVLPHIFEPYFTTKGARGTGLGLSTVYGLVRQNGGAVRVESEPETGTRFCVLLPTCQAEAPAPTLDRREQPSTRRARVLVVDDTSEVRRALCLLLELEGFEVHEAHDGQHALELVRAAPDDIDLVISDVRMPRMGGVELVRRARELRPTLPMVLISGYADSLEGVNVPVLSKPFTAAELLRVTAAALG